MIEIKNLSRSFGELKAVDNISFTINSGEITGFLGPNGAGKTTTMRMMVGYLRPDEGSIYIEGQDIFADPLGVSSIIGYLPEHNPLYEEMRVFEALDYFAGLRKLSKEFYKERKGYVVNSCGLGEVLTQKIGTLSKGYRQRLGLALAILHDPRILILDEPTSGLDPNQILEIRQLIRELGKEKTLILSSHIMQEIQALSDRVIIINKGRIAVDDKIDNLDSYIEGSQFIELGIKGQGIELNEFYAEFPMLKELERTEAGNELNLKLSAPLELQIRQSISRYVTLKGWDITTLYARKRSLEEIFYDLTKREDEVLALKDGGDEGYPKDEPIEGGGEN